jgi:hypothetical protein
MVEIFGSSLSTKMENDILNAMAQLDQQMSNSSRDIKDIAQYTKSHLKSMNDYKKMDFNVIVANRMEAFPVKLHETQYMAFKFNTYSYIIAVTSQNRVNHTINECYYVGTSKYAQYASSNPYQCKEKSSNIAFRTWDAAISLTNDTITEWFSLHSNDGPMTHYPDQFFASMLKMKLDNADRSGSFLGWSVILTYMEGDIVSKDLEDKNMILFSYQSPSAAANFYLNFFALIYAQVYI